MRDGRGLWSLNKAVALTRKDTGIISPCPWPQDQAGASGPVSSTKADTRFPLQTWLCSSYLITRWMHLLPREKASCRLCSQLLLWLLVLSPFCHLFLPCFFHSCMCTRVSMLHSAGPQVFTHVRGSAHEAHASEIFPSCLLLFINSALSVQLGTWYIIIGNMNHDFHFSGSSQTSKRQRHDNTSYKAL